MTDEALGLVLHEEQEKGERVAVIRTSDRVLFKQCRRKWGWNSHLRQNIGPKQNAAPLWFGTAFHYVMEDYHGHRIYKDPKHALLAYAEATKKQNSDQLPDDWKDLLEMGYTMIDYYVKWAERRKHSLLPTYVHNGVPQVEVNFRIPIPVSPELLARSGYDRVIYSGTIDRVVIDHALGVLWLLDYKTAKQFAQLHFQTDPQITTYCWAGAYMYDMPVQGMIYAQHLKREIGSPRILKSGKMSIAQNQSVTHITYKEGLIDLYGSIEKSPVENVEYLNNLAKLEDERQDKFIRYDYVNRSARMQEAEGKKILLECEDMLNPNLPLYPNPTRDCAHMCAFNGACVSMDDGSDWEGIINDEFKKRDLDYDSWRKYLKPPEAYLPKTPEVNQFDI